MSAVTKIGSVRCDMHPPMSASMFCEHCKKFLCKICAVAQASGRMCAVCKRPVKQPTPEEFAALVAERARAKDDARLAKEAEGRILAAQEKARLERDAKAKEEFARRKAAWA